MDFSPLAVSITAVAALITAVGGLLYNRSKQRTESASTQSQVSQALWDQVKDTLARNEDQIRCLQQEVTQLRDSQESLQRRHDDLESHYRQQEAENRALAEENRHVRDALSEIAAWIHSLGVEVPEAIRRHLKATRK